MNTALTQQKNRNYVSILAGFLLIVATSLLTFTLSETFAAKAQPRFSNFDPYAPFHLKGVLGGSNKEGVALLPPIGEIPANSGVYGSSLLKGPLK